jgi:hypothetical protein
VIGQRVIATRLSAQIALATASGWTIPRPAVIDTGAGTSVIPPVIWKQSRFVDLGRVRIGGINKRKECQIPAILAEIECILSDDQSVLGPLRMHAYLAEPEDAPRLIGILGFIERGVLRVELSKNRASLRMP